MSGSTNHPRSIERADASAHGPATIEPAIAHRTRLEDMVAQRSGNDSLREHGAIEQSHGAAQQQEPRTQFDIGDAFPQFMKEPADCAVVPRWRSHADNVASFAHKKVAEERYDVAGKVDKQNSAQADRVVDKADHGSRYQPATLETGNQETVGVHKVRLRGKFLNEGVDGGPEHPETGCDQYAHQINLPERSNPAICQHCHQ